LLSGIISSDEFRALLYQALLDSRKEISALTTDLKKQYNKAWGDSEWLEKRLAKAYTSLIIDHILDIIQEAELNDVEEERQDQG